MTAGRAATKPGRPGGPSPPSIRLKTTGVWYVTGWFGCAQAGGGERAGQAQRVIAAAGIGQAADRQEHDSLAQPGIGDPVERLLGQREFAFAGRCRGKFGQSPVA